MKAAVIVLHMYQVGHLDFFFNYYETIYIRATKVSGKYLVLNTKPVIDTTQYECFCFQN